MSVPPAPIAQTPRTENLTSGQPSEVINGLNRFRNSKAFCDAELEVDAQTFPVHKCVLASVSDFFFKLFTTEMREKYEDKIPITGVSATTLGDVLDFVYTSQITIREDNVFDILAASNYLMIETLKELCTDFLLGDGGKFLTVENSMKTLLASRQHQATRLEEKSGEFIADHYAILRKEKWFLESNLQMVKIILALRNKSKHLEAEAYGLIMDWVEYDIEKRRDFFPKLFTSLDLNRISPEYQSTVISKNKLVFDFTSCTELVVKSLAQASVVTLSRSVVVFDKDWTRLRLYDVQNGHDRLLPKTSFNGVAAKLDNYIYIFGKRNEYSTGVRKLDLKTPTNGWQNDTAMLMETQCESAAVLAGLILVMGRRKLISRSTSATSYAIQCFNVTSRRWTTIFEGAAINPPIHIDIQLDKQSDTSCILNWMYQTLKYDGSTKSLQKISTKNSALHHSVCLDNLVYYFWIDQSRKQSVQLSSYNPESKEKIDFFSFKDVTTVMNMCLLDRKIVTILRRLNGTHFLALLDVGNKEWQLLREINNTNDFHSIL